MGKHRLAAEDHKVLGIVAQGPVRVGDLARTLGVNKWSLRDRLEKLRRYGLIKWEPYKPIAITPEGRRILEEHLPKPVEPVSTEISPVIEALPSDLHRALFRLTLDVIVAKQHLRDRLRDGWPSILVCGPTKTLKTSTARLVARVLGLDPSEVEHLCYPGRVAPGDPGVRRIQREGGVWEVKASADFDRPLVILDELDKVVGDSSLRNSLFAFLDDRSEITIEGSKIKIGCTAFVTANWPREKLLSDRFFAPFIRRSFVADTSAVAAGWPPGYAEKVGERLASLRVPRVPLSKLRPPREVPQEIREMVAKTMAEFVAPEGRDLWDLLPVLHAIRGRAALVGDLHEAAFEVLHDRLTLLSSLGVTVQGWEEELGRRWASFRNKKEPEIQRRVEEARAAREELEKAVEQHKRRVQARKTAKVKERIAFVAEREELRASLMQAKQDLARHRLAPGLRAALGELAAIVKGCRSPEALEDVKPLVKEKIEEARELIAEWKQAKAEAERKKLELKRRKEELQRALKEVKRLLGLTGPVSPSVIAAKLTALGIFQPFELTWEEEVPRALPDTLGDIGAYFIARILKDEPPLLGPRKAIRRITAWKDPWGRVWVHPGDPRPQGGEIKVLPRTWASPDIKLVLTRWREYLEDLLEELAASNRP